MSAFVIYNKKRCSIRRGTTQVANFANKHLSLLYYMR